MLVLIGKVIKKEVSDRKASIYVQTEYGAINVQAQTKETILKVIPIDTNNLVNVKVEFNTPGDITNIILKEIKRVGA